MKAWQFTGVDQPLQLVELDDPTPEAHEVVIDVKAAGLCHSDVSFVDGTLTPLLGSIPIVLGHEIAGVVSAVGSSVTEFEVGQRVGVPATTEGPGTATNGGFAEKVLVAERLVVAVPDGASFEQAAPATDAARTAYRAVETIGQVDAGTKVGIIGFGGLGSLGAQIALAVGAKVWVAEVNEEAWGDIRALGAESVSADIRDFADAQLDVIIDFAGFGTTTASAIEAIRHGGRIVQIGLARASAEISLQSITMKEITLVGASNGEKSEAVAVLDLIAQGKISSRTVPITFDEIPDYVGKLSRGEVTGRAVALY